MRTNATVLGVSAGAATADQLARVAVSAAANGSEITGILVADPDSADPTTGRVPQLARPVHAEIADAHDRHNDGDQKVTDADQTIVFSPNGNDGLPERLGYYNDFATTDNRQSDFAPGLVSLAFIKEAIWRGARFWYVTAVIGLLIGFGLYVKSPHTYQASTSLLLTLGPYEDVQTAAANEQAMAESRAVAGLAVRQLGLRESSSSFLASYTVTPVTDRVLLITASAPSSIQAVTRTGAVASAFLEFRATELEVAQKLVLESLDEQVEQTKQAINSISAQIDHLSSAQSPTPAQRSQLSSLRAQRNQAANTLTSLAQAVVNGQTSAAATTAAVKGSTVMDAAVPLAHSRLKPLVLYSAVGLVLGLALGLGIVVVRALASDRLRRRDDVAQALGAPVKLSVGRIRPHRWLPDRRATASGRDANVQRVVSYLDRAMLVKPKDAALAVVAVDDPRAAALSLISLAMSWAEQGRRVVLADLARGAPAAKLLGVSKPGINTVSAHGYHLFIAVPAHDDLAPVGPLGRAREKRSPFTEEVTAACSQADFVLTVATLDPAIGGDHLSTWALDAVVMVTAGRSSWTKIEAAGEMIRLSGTRLVSAVLVGADKTDESLGMVRVPEPVS